MEIYGPVGEINIPDNIETLGNRAFIGTYATTIIIPKSIKNWNDDSSTFLSNKIKTIIIEDGATWLPSGAFDVWECEYIEVPATVSRIGENALLKALTVKIKAGSPLSASSPNYPWGASNVIFEQ